MLSNEQASTKLCQFKFQIKLKFNPIVYIKDECNKIPPYDML